MKLFKNKIDNEYKSAIWMSEPTIMTSLPSNGRKCDRCGKETDILYVMSAGSIDYLCKECADTASNVLISECPTMYLKSYEEYKNWRRKYNG